MEFVLYFRRDGQVVNRQLTTSILINVMKEIILRCYMFSRRGWISTLLFASDWTPSPTDLSNYRKFMGEYYYKVTDQTGFMCSCVQGLANIRSWALFFSLFCLHCVGFIHKLHMVRPKKFSSQHHNLKSRRRKSLLSEITKKTLNWVPVGLEHSELAVSPFQSEFLKEVGKTKNSERWSLNKNKGTVVTRRAGPS